MPSGDAETLAPGSPARAGLTCEVWRQFTLPNEEISDEILRQAFVVAVNGSKKQWRSFMKLLRITGGAK